jgi:DNA-binding NarL/FixJ family response regulator
MAMPPATLGAFMHPPIPVTTHHEILQSLPHEVGECIKTADSRHGVVDVLGIIGQPLPDATLVLWAVHDDKIVLSPHERRLLTQVGAHLEAGYRARKVPTSVKAVLSATGRVVVREQDAPAASLLETHGARVSAARRPSSGRSADVIDLWPALLAGKVSLIPRGARARRRYEVIENSPASMKIRALSQSESAVLEHCARGLSVKLTAYTLGISPGTVSTRLGQAASKLGVASRLELLRIAALLAGDPRATLPDEELSAAEREVLDLLERGLSNAQIAKLRSRSTRTIANQIASLLRKTKSSSRRELVARTSAKN